MSAADYNRKRYQDGDLTDDMIVELVENFQRHNGLTVDGFAGPNTCSKLEGMFGEIEKFYPLPILPDGRKPIITSSFHTENPSRSSHKGVDFFYRWLDSDPDVAVGDGGAIKKKGKRKWWYPPKACAVAAAKGTVIAAENTKTGYKVWVDHGNGERTGYFHLASLMVTEGAMVFPGMELGLIGDNPNGHDGKHLHFEVSPVDRYAPKNPRIWLKGAKYV